MFVLNSAGLVGLVVVVSVCYQRRTIDKGKVASIGLSVKSVRAKTENKNGVLILKNTENEHETTTNSILKK